INLRLTLDPEGLSAPRMAGKTTGTATISAGGGEKIYSLTPTVSGSYTFKSTNSSGDPYGYLYDANRNRLASNDDGAGNRNFLITRDLTAGTTYYLGVAFYGGSATGTVSFELAAPTPTRGPIGRAEVFPEGMSNWGISSSVWATEKNGSDSDNYAYISGGAARIGQYDNGKYSMAYTRQAYDLTGVRQLVFGAEMGGDGDDFYTVFETDSDQTWPGHYDQWRHDDKFGANWYSLNVAHRNQPLYLKFGASPKSGGRDNPRGWLCMVRFDYTFYRLNAKKSVDVFQRKVYDFTSTTSNGKSPQSFATYWDNPHQMAVAPGINLFGTTGFYANDVGTVLIEADDTAAQNGLTLAGVYLCRSSNLTSTPTSNYHYIAANSDGSVTFQNTQAFVRTLISKNVVNSTNGTTEDIYIYPKFTQKKVTVTFENANAENKSGGGRRYESGHVGSAFANIVALWEANGRKTAANDNGIIWKTTDSGKNDVYKVRLPWKSAVRLQVQPAPSATPNGIRYRTSYNGQSTVTSFTLGQRIYSSNTDGYTLVNTEDITKGEFVLNANEYLVAPNTNRQTFYVGYSPKSYASMRSQILQPMGRSDLTGVARVGSISDLSGRQETTTNKTVTDTTGMQTSSAEGSILIDPARTGDAYTVTAMSPDGYYTSWANMSEDRNNDGKKDADAPARSKASRSANPQYVYGDEINVQLDIDNMRYYYKFIKQMNEGSGELITGSVVRERNTFLRLVNHQPPIKGTPVKRNGKVINRPEVEGEPVAGANVSISGSYGMTNAMGEYEVEIPITEDWGAVSFRVSADGSNYYGQVYIEDEDGLTILPALERFTAKAASLSYARATSSISGSRAMITNDALTVMAQVTASGSITPAAARFYIYDKDGLVRVNCAEDPTNYRVTFDRSTYKASMTWNPKQAMQAKDTVWVLFQDNTGKWYPPINMGYTFVNEISLNNFSLDSVGGSTVDGVDSTGETIDMIGNPIGNLGLGMLTGLNNPQNKTTSTYVPEGLSEDVEDEYAKTVTEFKFGFSPNISFEGKWKNGERQPPDPPPSGVHLDDDTEDNLGDLKDLGKAIFGTKKADGTRERELPSMDAPEGGGYATESKFSWSVQPQVGFKLTLSSRAGQEGVFVEDILVYLAVDAGIGAEHAVGLPLGFQLIVRLNLSGRIAGVYYMYNEYERTDISQSSSGSTFNQEDLGLYGSAKEVQNHTRHEGYVFFDLNLEIGLGIKWTIFYVGGTASFGFDFDFKFDHDGTHAYGQFNYNFGVSVEVLGFEVWSKETEFDGVELFSKDADEPFDFDYAGQLQSAQLKALSSFSEGGSYAIDRTVNRDYLQNRTAWHGQPTVWERFASLFDAAPAGNGETVLQRGTANNPQMSLTKINDTELLMIFVGDVPTRTDANARAVFYAIGDGMTWSNPQILDDDGTIDDYPNVCDLGDGRLLVTWSSGARVLADDATLEDSLKNLDIKATFFNKASKTFDTPVSLTHTTEEDYSADVMPHAAYDAETGRLLLTYTKTEYDNLSEQTNLGRAVSVIAYLFYENGAWQNTGDAYTAAELDQIAAGQANPDTFKEEYKQQWYGQRFLDLRVDRNPNAPLLRVVESDAIAYNGLALNAWTVDWDGSLETTTDRDVFLQIYNFEENSFTHIIRVTEATGQHALPRFARSDSNTYLFYGAQDFDEETGELKENGEIRYLNVSEAVRNERYTLTETDTSRYYELKYQRPEQTVEGPDGNVTIPAEVVWYPTDIAAQCNNIADYTVFVDGNGQMYLFFSDMDEESHSRLIRASAYLGTDNENASESTADINGWTIPVYLTDGESVCYAGIGGVAVGSIIYLASGKSNYEDETDTSLVLVRHEPYAELTLDSVDASDDYPLPGGSTALTAVVRNIGLRSWTEPVEVTFNMTAKDKDGAVLSTADVTGQYDGMIIGGAEAQVTAYVDIPETFDTLTFTATYNGETVTCERESGSFLAVTDDAIGVRVTDAGDRQQYASATVTNNGNKPSGVIAISCYTGEDGYLNGGTLPSLAPGESASFDYSLVISDSAYTIDGDGIGLADIYASVVELEDDSVTLLDAGDELTDPTQIESANGSEVARISGTAQKNFDAEAIQLLNDVTVPANIAFTVREDENGPLQPTLGGANAEQLRVDWITTSDPAVATIDATNAILPHAAGTATLTGIVTPNRTNFVFDADGNSVRQDWRDVIPEEMQREVTAEVTVLAAEPVPQPDPAPAGSHNVVFDSAGGSAVTYQVVQDGQRATEPAAPTRTGYDFLGWQFDGENYDFSTAVTEDIQLTAN
ncbi:MAG: InlB B-repeat-containing protein, partial [Oscillibacter sp.]|nr:InlB B-repeat-containing protein [Oscillibacter sp.]